ncbi:hypothetical protein BSKO_01208 [Bryopsis sp. KO-2023]|nr:hypothetical protein BSKO_01208 [Bryopsis sp. KO-2023]
MSSPPLAAYRHLLRVVRNVFKGDEAMLSGAYSELRSRFEASRADSDPGVVKKKLEEASEAADFIRSFVVQCHVNEKGTVRVKPEKHQVESMQDEITEEQFDISVKHGMSRPRCS